jgi:dTDP-4-dehydrorhamnose 3,5-epimerase
VSELPPVPRPAEAGICGVTLHALATHADERGALTEIFREEWTDVSAAVQWNYVTSSPNVLRGVHVHLHHTDYLVVVEGSVTIGLKDLRSVPASVGKTALLQLRASQLQALVIPPGVAHGFYCPEGAALIQAVSAYWSPADELGCRWNDPELGIRWPVTAPLLSLRDRALPSFAVLTRQVTEGLKR